LAGGCGAANRRSLPGEKMTAVHSLAKRIGRTTWVPSVSGFEHGRRSPSTSVLPRRRGKPRPSRRSSGGWQEGRCGPASFAAPRRDATGCQLRGPQSRRRVPFPDRTRPPRRRSLSRQPAATSREPSEGRLGARARPAGRRPGMRRPTRLELPRRLPAPARRRRPAQARAARRPPPAPARSRRKRAR
jgi:hypothetical protein